MVRRPRPWKKIVPTVLAVITGAIYLGSRALPADARTGPVLNAAAKFAAPAPGTVSSSFIGNSVTSALSHAIAPSVNSSALAEVTRNAVDAFASTVGPLSHPRALQDAFESYFAFKAARPAEVRKPFLYFVDYGLSSATPRGYVFDMDALQIVDGPFMVAHGRGSAANKAGIPTRFSNSFGAATTSLGLYVAQETYSFVGHAGGRIYSSVGLRLAGVSAGFNDNARARGVVAHGAPYVTANRAGRSEGCPAMEPDRAGRLLPKLANGSLVFLFAPDKDWMSRDPWLATNID